jgi:membrane protein implicated in regulation of membrane protease activity
MAPLIWLLLGLSFLTMEWLGAEFDGLLAAALAAFLLSVLTGLLPPLGLTAQVLLFIAGSGLLLLGIHRWSRRRERSIPPSHDADQATVISGFDQGSSGRVRWKGQSWAASSLAPQRRLRPGETVTVMGRDGNHVQVLPSP